VKIYRSKVDIWLAGAIVAAAVVVLIVGFSVVAGPVPAKWLIVAPMVLLGAVLPLWLLVSTDYRIADQNLLIRSGPFRWRIPIREIRNVRPTRNARSSPALSLDRLLITYGGGQSCMISPKDKEGFLNELRANGVTAA
jgi:uncharacterized membrane protein YdbT with pleckstrin-like domain